jgi:hypothetical protein
MAEIFDVPAYILNGPDLANYQICLDFLRVVRHSFQLRRQQHQQQADQTTDLNRKMPLLSEVRKLTIQLVTIDGTIQHIEQTAYPVIQPHVA